MASLKNIFAKITFSISFDLDELNRILPNAEYNPKKFNGLVLKYIHPRTTFVFFRTGKIIATGVRSHKTLDESVRILYRELRNTRLFNDLVFPCVEITNLTCSYDAECKFDLISFYSRYSNLCTYEKELFPALKLQLKSPDITILIFHNGKIILTGSINEFFINKSLKNVLFMLSDFICL